MKNYWEGVKVDFKPFCGRWSVKIGVPLTAQKSVYAHESVLEIFACYDRRAIDSQHKKNTENKMKALFARSVEC